MDLHDGNLFFMHKYPSVDIENAIKTQKSFEDFERFYTNDLMDENLLVGQYLNRLLGRYEMSANDLTHKIGKTQGYVSKIVNGTLLNPDRDMILAICIVLGTTVEEAQILLRYAGKQPLYARRKRDAIVWFALKKQQQLPSEQRDGPKALMDLDRFLDTHGTPRYKPLTKVIERQEK